MNAGMYIHLCQSRDGVSQMPISYNSGGILSCPSSTVSSSGHTVLVRYPHHASYA